MDLVFFRRSLNGAEQFEVPDGYQLRSWRPSIRRPYPKGAPGSWRFVLWPIIFAAYGRLNGYRAVIICDRDGSIVHTSMSFPKYFRFPFMARNDVQVGNLWTRPDHRGKGLASAGVVALLSVLSREHAGHRVWYVAPETNRSSIAVAASSGFEPVGRGRRWQVGRFAPLSRYRYAEDGPFDYSIITEDWDTPANVEQREMSYVRHGSVREHAAGRRLLDVACGTGYGFAFASASSRVGVGVDLTWTNLAAARRHLPKALLVQASAEALPFREQAFDVVSCLEAFYYFADQPTCLGEMHRLLDADGAIVLSMPNPARPGFNRSPGATTYPTTTSLAQLLDRARLDFAVYGAFRWGEETPRDRLVEVARVLATKAGAIPNSLAARALLKRLIFRDMRPVSEFDGTFDVAAALEPLMPPSYAGSFKILMAVARVKPSDQAASASR